MLPGTRYSSFHWLHTPQKAFQEERGASAEPTGDLVTKEYWPRIPRRSGREVRVCGVVVGGRFGRAACGQIADYVLRTLYPALRIGMLDIRHRHAANEVGVKFLCISRESLDPIIHVNVDSDW